MRKKLFAIIAILLCSLLAFTSCGNRGLTLSDYNRLYIGMSHPDAMDIVGQYATRILDMGNEVVYSVEGSGGEDSFAILVFHGSPLRLTSSSQNELR